MRRTVRSIVLTAAGVAGVCLWHSSLAAPSLHAVATGAGRRYKIAPIKAGDDWDAFFDQLDKFKSNMPNAKVEMSDSLYGTEKCGMDANCDVVTIERQSASYTFKIKNATRSHPVRQACYTCQVPGAPPGVCDAIAQGPFVQFVFEHDICHEDPQKCTESICQ